MPNQIPCQAIGSEHGDKVMPSIRFGGSSPTSELSRRIEDFIDDTRPCITVEALVQNGRSQYVYRAAPLACKQQD